MSKKIFEIESDTSYVLSNFTPEELLDYFSEEELLQVCTVDGMIEHLANNGYQIAPEDM